MGDHLLAVIAISHRGQFSRDGKWALAKLWWCVAAWDHMQGSFHSWMSVWAAGESVWSFVNTCHSERFRGEYLYFKIRLSRCLARGVAYVGQVALNSGAAT